MGPVRRLAAAAGDVTLGQAAEAYLVTLGGAEQASTRRTYGRILRRAVAEFGPETAPDEVDAERFAEWFGSQWADRAPSTWNVSLDAIRSAAAYWQRQGWLAAAFSRSEVDQLLTRKNISLRERTLWRMLYETAARSAEVLALDVEDLDLPNRQARVRRKGGALDIIVWQTGTARLLPRLLKDRKTGRCSLPSGRPVCSSPRPTWTSTDAPGSATSRSGPGSGDCPDPTRRVRPCRPVSLPLPPQQSRQPCGNTPRRPRAMIGCHQTPYQTASNGPRGNGHDRRQPSRACTFQARAAARAPETTPARHRPRRQGTQFPCPTAEPRNGS